MKTLWLSKVYQLHGPYVGVQKTGVQRSLQRYDDVEVWHLKEV
jgi:hypothetical protein